MSEVVDQPKVFSPLEDRKKRRLLEITTVAMSGLPHRVAKARTGVVLGSFACKEAMDEFIANYPLALLESKPTRRRAAR